MNEPITRKHFLHLGLGAMSLAACGGDDGTDEGAGTDDTGADTTASTSNTTTASTSNTTTASTSATTNSTTESTSVSTTDDDDTTTSETTDGDDTTESGSTDDSTGADTTTGAANMCEADPTSMFSAHMHTLDIPLADIIAGAEQNYVAGGTHTHDVTLTAEDFATLRETGQVVVMAAEGGEPPHPHTVTITCA